MTSELYELQTQLQNSGLSDYDAAYVAVAKMLKGKWITFDEKAHKTIQKMQLSVLA